MLCDLKPGDEAIMPSFTFVSTANAVVRAGAKPVFVDIRPDTLNIDERLIEKSITEKTRAIFPVHYAGVSCEMDAIMEIAGRHGIPVVEDNAHGLFGKYKGRQLGTFGALATQSFHETKNFNCGEGGALLINDRAYAERAEIIREKLTLRLRQELPYGITVEIERFELQEDGRLLIGAVIWVERAGQKAIVIGQGGERLKEIGRSARMELKNLFNRPVHLELWVKVKDNWSDSEAALRQLGYEGH